MKRTLLLLFYILFVTISYAQWEKRMLIDESPELIIFYPQYGTIDLVCGEMPNKHEKNVLFCCEAAFTGELLKDFKHSNIAGNHVSGGVYYKGYKCRVNTGIFVFYNGKWKFLLGEHEDELKEAAKNEGMGFGQNMIIFEGVTQPSFRKLGSKFQYRALCEYNGRLCVIDSRKVVAYRDFISALEKIKVTYALYLDMGSGWNYSWFRDDNGIVKEIHPKGHNYTTNWLVFKK